MNESASLSFLSNAHDLIHALSAMRASVEEQIEKGLKVLTIKYLFAGRASVWYANHHQSIVGSARSCATRKSALEAVSQITFSAYSSSSGATQLTKGKAFKRYIELLPAASEELGSGHLGKRALADYEAIVSLIDGHKEKPQSASKRSKEKPLVTTQMQQADALCERLLAQMSVADRHIMREKIKRADNKLVALLKLMET